jgi:hypothetical protein
VAAPESMARAATEKLRRLIEATRAPSQA